MCNVQEISITAMLYLVSLRAVSKGSLYLCVPGWTNKSLNPQRVLVLPATMRVSGCMRVSEWMRISKHMRVSKWVSEGEWVRVSECMRVKWEYEGDWVYEGERACDVEWAYEDDFVREWACEGAWTYEGECAWQWPNVASVTYWKAEPHFSSCGRFAPLKLDIFGMGLGLCGLTTPGLSKDSRWPYFSKLANHQIRHQATHKVGSQPSDSIWSFQSSSEVCVGMYGFTYSLYHPQG